MFKRPSGELDPWCSSTPLTGSIRLYTWYFFPFIHMFGYCILPFLFIFSMNIAIVTQLFRAQSRRKRMQSGASKGPVVNSMTPMLLTVSFIFIICSIPAPVHVIIQFFFYINIRWLVYFGEILLALNHSINFFLYVLSGRKFRTELKNMFMCKS